MWSVVIAFREISRLAAAPNFPSPQLDAGAPQVAAYLAERAETRKRFGALGS